MITIFQSYIFSATVWYAFSFSNQFSTKTQFGKVWMQMSSKPQTMFDKIWASHLVDEGLIYIDRHLVHEVTSPQAFEGLRTAGRKVRRPDCTLVTVDHNVPTSDRSSYISASTFIDEPE